jgi:malonyl CoA-acyl carrier protein transacylase
MGERGTVTHRLAAAAAFHSPLMAGITAPFGEFVAGLALRGPAIPVYGNADAGVYPPDPAAVGPRLAEHLLAPVRFVEQIEAMYADGVRVFVEVGAGAVLTGLVGRILGTRDHLAVPLDHRDRDGVTALQDGLGRLAAHGMALDLGALWAPFAVSGERGTGDERGKSVMTVPIDGGNRGRRYPVAGDNVVLPAPAPAPSEVDPVGDGAALPTTPEPAPLTAVDDGWLAVVQDAQRQTAEVHAEYLRTMTETHQAFLRMSEESMTAVLGGQGTVPATSANGHCAATPAPDPVLPAVPDAPAALPVLSAPPEVPPPAPVAAPERADETPDVPGSDVDGPGVVDVVLSVVSELTGYPVEILDLDMGLEGDLGIDSIKRVEILSAMREQVSGLPQQDVARLAKLRTLREVVDAVEVRSSHPRGTRAGAEPPPARAEPPPPVRRLAVRACPAPATGLAVPGLAEGPVAVTDDGTGVAAEVVDLLAGHGIVATVVAEPPPDARGVVFLGGLSPVDGPGQADAVLRAAFRTARVVARAFSDRGGVFVTVQDTGGDFGLDGRCGERAWVGGVAALARTAGLEWPDAVVKAIDCERADRTSREVAEAVVGELLRGGAATDVGLAADGTRVVPRAVPAEPATERHDRLGPDAVVLVSGGARGITAVALRALVTEHRPRLVLLGRTPLTDEPDGLADLADEPALVAALARRDGGGPAELTARARHILAVREVRATLADLDPAGTRVRYVPVDVRQPAALAVALREVRAEWGPFTGVVHAAGVIDDHRIEDKTDDQLDAVLGPKLAGLRALLAATADDPLSVLCLFSSVAGVFGNAGQGDYAMANGVLDVVASVERVRRPGCLVRSVAWGPWRGGMVTPAVAERFAGAGVALLDPDAGAAAFVTELSAPAGSDSRVVLAASVPAPAAPPPGEIHVTARTHPYLCDHRPLDVPVVPVAVVLDWFVRAVRAWQPGDGPLALREVRVLHTAALPRLGEEGHRFLVTGQGSGGDVRVELRGEASRSHCQAVVGLTEAPGTWSPPAGLTPPAEPMAYGGPTYFHGPTLQVVREVRAVGAAGLVTDVAGLREQGWGGTGWLTDPAATDGAFQSAVLWAEHVLGTGTLPMAVERYRLHRSGPLPAGGRCVVRSGAVHDDGARCDVALLDPHGRPWVELLGVALVRRPR